MPEVRSTKKHNMKIETRETDRECGRDIEAEQDCLNLVSPKLNFKFFYVILLCFAGYSLGQN